MNNLYEKLPFVVFTFVITGINTYFGVFKRYVYCHVKFELRKSPFMFFFVFLLSLLLFILMSVGLFKYLLLFLENR